MNYGPVLFQTDLGMSPGHIGEVLSIKGRHLPDTPSGQSLHQTLISHTQLGEASCTVGQTCQVVSLRNQLRTTHPFI